MLPDAAPKCNHLVAPADREQPAWLGRRNAPAPCDPVFWMHHAEIDRLWSVWQASHAGQNPPLAGAAAVMDPWSETEVDTRDIEALGYTYA